MSLNVKKFLILFVCALVCVLVGSEVLAASGAGGVGAVASRVKGNLSDIAQLITAGSYVAGMGFAIGAIVKFKAHKDNPTQVTIGMPIALLFVAAALLFAPGVFKASGGTLFASGQGSISGVTKF